MAIEFDPITIANLTTSQLGTTLDPERISEWCLSQHFSNDYQGMYLIVIAIISIYAYQTVFKFDFNIPEYKTKSGKILFNREILLNDLFLLIKLSILIFALYWLYQVKDWHWLDWLFELYS